MTTFTLQDLTPEQHVAVENHEEIHAMLNPAQLLTDHLNTPEVPKETKDALVHVLHTRHVTEPQPTLGEVLPKPDINTIINTICAQLQLLSTVINQQPNTTPPEGNSNTTLQETVALTLQQADWFSDLIRHELIGAGIEDLAKEAVKDCVENEVEHYFDYNFSVTDHFDFDDAVSDAVDDRLDDLVKEKIDECIEDVVAEKLSSANVSISF